MIDAPKDRRTRTDNQRTQPLREHRVFNSPEAVPRSWFPVCPTGELARGQARSSKTTFQPIVVFRGDDGVVRALDAFCPHMGADLGNGRVCGNEIECYFHQFRLNGEGCVTNARGVRKLKVAPKNSAYRIEAKYGFLLVVLQDDDVKAFPHMRFDPRNLVAEDTSLARLVRFIDGLPLSGSSRCDVRENARASA